MTIDWDLSGRHTLKEVAWPQDRLDSHSTSVEPLESVSIRLPAGETLKVGDRAKRIILYRRSNGPEPLPAPEGETLETVEVYSTPLSVEDAYRRATAYAEQFQLPRAPLDGWRKRRKQGSEDATDRTTTTDLDQRLGGDDGPIPTVELLYSFNDERPWAVMVSFFWPPPEVGRGPS